MRKAWAKSWGETAATPLFPPLRVPSALVAPCATLHSLCPAPRFCSMMQLSPLASFLVPFLTLPHYLAALASSPRPAPLSQLLLQLMARVKFALSFSFSFSAKNLKNKRSLTAKCGWDHKFTRPHGGRQMITQVIRTLKDSPRQTLSSARTLQALHKNSKQTCKTQQAVPLAADCTPTLKSAFAKPPKNYKTKNLSKTRVHSVILSLSLCKLVTCKNESYLPCMSAKCLYILCCAPKLFVYEVT